MKRRARMSGVTLLAAAVLVLLPSLAWLQYSWLDQIAVADRERRERTLRTAASQLAQDLEGEVGRAVSGLQLESSMVEREAWSSYAIRYEAWAESAIAPGIVKAVYFVEGPELASAARPDPPSPAVAPIRVWNAAAQSFEPTEWPAELAPLKLRLTTDGRRIETQTALPRERGIRGFERLIVSPTTSGTEQAIVVPVVRLSQQSQAPNQPPPLPDFKLLGFTIVRIDLGTLAGEVLPSLVQRDFFDDREQSDYLVGVVRREDPSQVVYESAKGAADAALAQPDTDMNLLGPRMGPVVFMADRREGPPRRPEDRIIFNVFEGRREPIGNPIDSPMLPPIEGQWRLVAKHRAGSLEAAVASARTRNLVLSSGILALLAAAIGLIVVSARRADRLARQQLEFVAAVSHELRTPVSVIGAAAENLADGLVAEPARIRKYGATIQSEARRLGETVERVLQLAGIAAGRAPARAAVAAAGLIEDAVAASRHEIESAGAHVEVRIAPELLHVPSDPTGVQRVVADAAALRSAIQELISNAIKYGGDEKWARVTAACADRDGTRITVEDRGLGIAAEDRGHVFEPFYRGREAVARQIQGSGLGLHLVRRIVEAHDGTVSVQSEPGRGSTFTIWLPGVHDFLSRLANPRKQSPVAADL